MVIRLNLTFLQTSVETIRLSFNKMDIYLFFSSDNFVRFDKNIDWIIICKLYELAKFIPGITL